jgi:hypothetical protein
MLSTNLTYLSVKSKKNYLDNQMLNKKNNFLSVKSKKLIIVLS